MTGLGDESEWGDDLKKKKMKEKKKIVWGEKR